MRTSAWPALLLSLSATPLLSQATTTPESPPAALPARPTITTPAALPPVGYLQFEQGFNQANNSPGLDHQFSLVQNTKLAVHPHLLVQLITQPFARTLQPPISKDQGDVLLGGQLLLTPAPRPDQAAAPSPQTPQTSQTTKSADPAPPAHGLHLAAVSLGYTGRVRSGTSADLDVGSFSQGLLLLVDGTLPGLPFTVNFIVNEQTDSRLPNHPVHRAQLGQTFSATHQFTQKASFTGELWHFTQPTVFATRNSSPVAHANAVGLLFTGGYVLRPDLVLDAGFERGVTSTSTAWQGFAGFTYLLPHRLWKGGPR